MITYVNHCHQGPVTIGMAPCMNERANVLANFHFRVSMNCLLSMIVLQELVCGVIELLDLLSNVTLCVVCIYMLGLLADGTLLDSILKLVSTLYKPW